MKKLLLLLAFAPLLLMAQSRKQKKALLEQQKAEQVIVNNFKSHIKYLSDEKLEGRLTGSKGEALAMDYISNQFKQIGLQPKGTNGYIQEFIIDEGKQIEQSTYLRLNGKTLVLKQDYIPLAFSATKSVTGMPAMALRERGVPWFFDVKDLVESNASNPGFNIDEALQKEAARAASKGATALFVFNSSNAADKIWFNNKDNSTVSIPVVYIMPQGYKKYFSDQSQLLDIEMNVAFSQKNRNGHNVVGYIDNGAPTTVVIGAHYDALGMGEDANALDTSKVVHTGADDNASGTAMLIELARMLAASKAKTNNYLFIAFSGEEISQLGSKYWLDKPTVTTPINYMINLDMVGRYDADKKLLVGGSGTSPLWSQLISSLSDKSLQVKLDSTASGAGDYTSFYSKGVPVLFFNTGFHADYHKSTDVADKINYDGELQIAKYITRLIEATDSKGKLAFSKAPEPVASPAKNPTVSLGVIADNNYTLGGLKISGVSAKKTASRIGLEPGDILVQLGSFKINDMNSYIQALSNFKPGDRTTLRIKRGKEDREIAVEF
jgi:aminopeptidase YwaD